MLEIDKMIMEAIKSKDENRKKVYKNIKAKILELKTAKNAKVYDDAAEIAMLKKMHSELVTDKGIFLTNGRSDLADAAQSEIEVFEELLPKAATKEDIQKVIDDWIATNGEINQKAMGLVMKEIKNKLPSADGKVASELVRNMIS